MSVDLPSNFNESEFYPFFDRHRGNVRGVGSFVDITLGIVKRAYENGRAFGDLGSNMQHLRNVFMGKR